MDIERNLKIAITTGKVLFGSKEAEKSVKKKTAKMIVLASNFSNDFLENQEIAKVLDFPGDNVALGALCGKPFSISVLTIIDAGGSRILSR
ncbi:MAG: 50S ribosomal protein L30e [Thermoplasmata archaeon]